MEEEKGIAIKYVFIVSYCIAQHKSSQKYNLGILFIENVKHILRKVAGVVNDRELIQNSVK